MSFHKNKVNMQHNFRPEIKRTDLTQANSLVGLRSRPYDGKIAGLYDLEETLGRGHFAVVKLARHVFTGEKVAVKVIDKSKLDEVSRAHLFQEVRCMKLVQHPNVVRLYEVIDTATKLYLVLELGDGGDLYEYILKHETGLPEKIAKEYFTQIVRAISYCHQLHVVHRDLKPENVVFFKNRGIVKLTDFGFSNKFYPGQKLETSCGSLAYSAPEILLGDSYDAPAVDVWSLGVILYMLVCGQPPFQEANDSETLTMIMDCKYDIPAHVSDTCRKLISRMLVKNPDKRATLMEITSHPWLSDGKQDIPDMFPLVSKEQLSEEDHNLIVQKIVNGNIATKEEILDCLEKNEYNHVTATYYLLAERKLKSKVQEQLNKSKRPDQLSVSQAQASEKNKCTATRPFLSIPRTPGDLPQRSRKCSIVQEDEEEGEDISPCSRQENLGEPLIRRGSRSEGRLNLAVQERIAESEGRKPGDKILIEDKKNRDIKISDSNAKVSILKCNMKSEIPKVTVKSDKEIELEKYNNEIPPSSQIGTSYLQLNEIFEESEMFNILQTTPRKFLNRNQLYEKRKLKFHKNRTASCSSSDASDDDSEKRKKQAEKLNSSTKSFQGRRDSHDDSSDSQETGASAGSNENKKFGSNKVSLHSNKNTEYQKHKIKSNNNSGKKNTSNTNLMVTRKHKFVKKKNGKTTHLKENQSLNRINEVQEDGSSSVLISTIFSIHSNLPLLVADKAINESFIKSFNDCEKYSQNQKYLQFDKIAPYCSTKCQKKYIEATYMNFLQKQSIHDRVEKCNLKKSGILNKYFHVKKKICIALPELFNKTPLHQAQSYSSLTKKFVMHSTVRPTVVNKKSVINVEVETNQNEKDDTLSIPNKIKVSSTCQKLTKSYAPHIGNASKCYN